MIWDLKSLSLFLFMHRCSQYLQENILVLIKSCLQSYILRTFPFKHETRLLSIIYYFGIFQNLPLPTHFYANQNIFLQIWWTHMVSINFFVLIWMIPGVCMLSTWSMFCRILEAIFELSILWYFVINSQSKYFIRIVNHLWILCKKLISRWCIIWKI